MKPRLRRVPAGRLRRALRHVRWYLREVSGEAAYDTYVAHQEGSHPGAPVLSRREFEDRRARPTVRCC